MLNVTNPSGNLRYSTVHIKATLITKPPNQNQSTDRNFYFLCHLDIWKIKNLVCPTPIPIFNHHLDGTALHLTTQYQFQFCPYAIKTCNHYFYGCFDENREDIYSIIYEKEARPNIIEIGWFNARSPNIKHNSLKKKMKHQGRALQDLLLTWFLGLFRKQGECCIFQIFLSKTLELHVYTQMSYYQFTTCMCIRHVGLQYQSKWGC